MTVILQQPSSVLVVSRTGETGPQVRTALAGASDTTVRHEPDTDGALAALDDSDDIGCVVLDESVPDILSPEALSKRDDHLPGRVPRCGGRPGDARPAHAVPIHDVPPASGRR